MAPQGCIRLRWDGLPRRPVQIPGFGPLRARENVTLVLLLLFAPATLFAMQLIQTLLLQIATQLLLHLLSLLQLFFVLS